MQPIVAKEWKKEDELRGLKSELAALDRKIQLDLAPPTLETTEKAVDVERVTIEEQSTYEHGITPFPRNATSEGERLKGIRI